MLKDEHKLLDFFAIIAAEFLRCAERMIRLLRLMRSRPKRLIHMTPSISIDPLLRVVGRDAPLAEVVARVQARSLPVTLHSPTPGEDFALIDPALAVVSDSATPAEDAPAPGLSYAGFGPRQRGWFLAWQLTPLTPAPLAFQQLYLASLEVRLLEGNLSARRQLEQFLHSDAWTPNPGLWRVALLAAWLAQDGGALANWLTAVAASAEVTGMALGMQALLGAPLTAAEVRQVARTWEHPVAALAEAVLAFRLQSLAAALGETPLAWALAQQGDGVRRSHPWRCQHRDLRIELPQPDARRALEPLLTELAQVTEAATPKPTDLPGATAGVAAADSAASDDLSRAHLILEFRQSRSEFFAVALRQAQKRAGFAQLLDEDRHVVYRVAFRKNEMAAFWQMWNYAQNWTGTRVYCRGQELQRWQISFYSQYLR